MKQKQNASWYYIFSRLLLVLIVALNIWALKYAYEGSVPNPRANTTFYLEEEKDGTLTTIGSETTVTYYVPTFADLPDVIASSARNFLTETDYWVAMCILMLGFRGSIILHRINDRSSD